ncbi:MAG TPA: hypothetical protein VMU36_11245 [Spirochaetia bacterium]|nr:hypothetical protein [Spirochaetia bacterium]
MFEEQRFQYDRAGPGDGEEMEDILELQPLEGRIGLAYTRRPDAFASFLLEGDPVDVVVCRDRKEGRIAAMGMSALRLLHVNGQPLDVGYLFGLRARPEYIRAFPLHRGYARIHEMQTRPTSFFLTSILEENIYAQRLLEKRRPFMPVYEPLCSYTVFAMGTGRLARRSARKEVRRAGASDLPRLISFLAEHGKGQQFFPVVTEDSFGRPPFAALRAEDFLLWEEHGNILAAAGLWNQQSYRQYRVTGYRGLYHLLRPLSHLLFPWGFAVLPRTGEELRYLTLCLPAVRGGDPALFAELIEEALAAARSSSILLAGVAAGHPFEPVFAAHRHVSYRSRIYLVWWPEQAPAVSKVRRDMPVHIECGFL